MLLLFKYKSDSICFELYNPSKQSSNANFPTTNCIGVKPPHQWCGASTHYVRTINTIIEEGEKYPYLPPKLILLTTNYLRR